jgi:hypothetical protein
MIYWEQYYVMKGRLKFDTYGLSITGSLKNILGAALGVNLCNVFCFLD